MKRVCQYILPPVLALCLVAGIVFRMDIDRGENALNVYSRPDLEPVYVDNGEADVFDTDIPLDSQEGYSQLRDLVHQAGLPWVHDGQVGLGPDAPQPTNIRFALPCDVHYYIKDGGRYTLVHTDKAGKEVRFVSPMGQMMAASGVRSLPTRDRGWRLTQPLTDGTGIQDWAPASKETTLYYVPLSDLETVAEYLVETEGDYLRQCVDLEGRVTADTTDEELARILLYYVDSELYRAGIYRSPDFYRPYWDGINIALAVSAGGLLLGWAAWLAVWRKR